MAVLDRAALEESPLADLHTIARELGLDGFRRLRKAALIDAIMQAHDRRGAGRGAQVRAGRREGGGRRDRGHDEPEAEEDEADEEEAADEQPLVAQPLLAQPVAQPPRGAADAPMTPRRRRRR